MFLGDVLIVPEEVELLHETLLLSLQPLSDSVHFPETRRNVRGVFIVSVREKKKRYGIISAKLKILIEGQKINIGP